jgi:hypothetical protein
MWCISGETGGDNTQDLRSRRVTGVHPRTALFGAGTLGVGAWSVANWTAPAVAPPLAPLAVVSVLAVAVATWVGPLEAGKRAVRYAVVGNALGGVVLAVYALSGGTSEDPLADPVVLVVVTGGQTAALVGATAFFCTGLRMLRTRVRGDGTR